jgi:phosphotriesterase-related protein
VATIRTVLGDISPDGLGFTLAHEHVLCDFIGADKVSRERYDPQEVLRIMLPYFGEIMGLGVRGFVDCTPAYLGRDAQLLANLSRATGINILTNTGLYKEPYLPPYAFECSIDGMAERWTLEIDEGIDGTIVKAGFIKIAVNPGDIVPVQQKVVRAAARCSLSTGAVIACHTGEGRAAIQLLKIVEDEGLDPDRLIVVHCDAIEDLKYHAEIARHGSWIEYDGISEENADRTLGSIDFAIKNGFEGNILLSQDAGWYNVGEVGGGHIRGYVYIVRDLIPMLLRKGFDQESIKRLFITNPARAFRKG